MPGPLVYDAANLLHSVLFGTGEQTRVVNFEPSDEDTSGTVQYFGFLSVFGTWIIMARDTTTAVVTYRYAAGKGITTTYADAFTGKAALTYYTFDAVMSHILP